MDILLSLIAAGVIMGILDFLWLGYIAKRIYYRNMGKILLAKPNMVPALIFYAIYVVGIVIFVVGPALELNSWTYALSMGMLFGLVTYATYDLTNLATLKGFSKKVAFVDIVWGMFLSACVALGSYLAVGWIL